MLVIVFCIGLYTEGVYRKSAGVSSKKAVRAALEEGSFKVYVMYSLLANFEWHEIN